MQYATRPSTNGRHAPRRGLGPVETILRSVRRYWPYVLVLPFLLLAGTALGLRLMTRTFEARAQVRIDEQRSNLAVLEALKSLSSGSQIETEMVVIRSRTMAESVIDTLSLNVRVASPRGAPRSRYFERLAARPDAAVGEWVIRTDASGTEVKRTDGPGEPLRFGRGEVLRFGGVEAQLTRDGLEQDLRIEVMPYGDVVRGFQRTLKVARPNREADIIQITYASPDSLLVRDVVNTVVQHFIRRRNAERSTEAVDMVAFLNQQIDTLSRQLTIAEEALRDFGESSGIVAMKAQTESYVAQLADLKAQRDLADTERRAMTQLVRRERSTESNSLRNIVGFQTILKSPSGSELLRALNDAENSRAELLQRRTSEDPDVQILTERIGELEEQLRGIANSYLIGLNETVTALDDVLSGYAEDLRRVPEQEIRLARLRREADLLEEIHTLLQTRAKEAEIAAAVHDSSVRLVDPAIAPARPVSPKPKLSLAFATVMGLGLGIVGAVLREHADRTVRTREELQQTLPGLPILSVVPHTRAPRANGKARLAVAGIDTPSAEAYRQLRTNLTFAHTEHAQQVLVMTSPTPGDGKSLTSTNLAAIVAQQGSRCLLVDADMRRGLLNETLGVARDPGLSQVLANQVRFEDAVQTLPVPGAESSFDFLPTGVHPPNPAELLASKNFAKLIDLWRSRYDLIVLDAPPLNLVTDASLMGTSADGVLVVVRSGVTRADALEFAMDQLEAVKARVLGAVLNDVNIKAEGYYGNYSGYYGRDKG